LLADVCSRKKTSKQCFNADGNPKITTKGHLLHFRLGTLHLAKGARHPQKNFSWSLVYRIVFRIITYLLDYILFKRTRFSFSFFSVSESVKLHILF